VTPPNNTQSETKPISLHPTASFQGSGSWGHHTIIMAWQPLVSSLNSYAKELNHKKLFYKRDRRMTWQWGVGSLNSWDSFTKKIYFIWGPLPQKRPRKLGSLLLELITPYNRFKNWIIRPLRLLFAWLSDFVMSGWRVKVSSWHVENFLDSD